MSTMNRIVLLNPQGEELFSGDSLLSEPPPPPTLPREEIAAQMSDDDEPIPETLRSSVLVRAHEPVSRPIIVEDAEPGHRAA